MKNTGFQLTKSDLIFIGILYIVLIAFFFIDMETYDVKWFIYFQASIYISLSMICLYVLVYQILSRFLFQKQYVKMILYTLILFLVAGAVSNLLYDMVTIQNKPWYHYLRLYYSLSDVSESVGLVAAFLVGKKVYDKQGELLRMANEKKESELRLLNNQVDPHFLFNNLNSIDSLIDSDPAKAKTYLKKLSDLYRNILKTKDQDLISLSEEIQISQNYIYLISERYGDCYQFEIDPLLSDELFVINKLIPPGSLQGLLENIVKHNKTNPKEPLISIIKIEGEYLIVSNPINRKSHVDSSNKFGLENLKKRVEYFSDKELIIQDDKDFIVKIPLIYAL